MAKGFESSPTAWLTSLTLTVLAMAMLCGCSQASSTGVPYVEVPAIQGMPVEEAESLLLSEGFRVEVVERHGPPDTELARGPGFVYRQDPEAGTMAPSETTVTIWTWWERQ